MIGRWTWVELYAPQNRSSGMPDVQGQTRRRIRRIGPYTATLIVLVPLMIIEPLKLVAVAIAGAGHWFTGTIVLIAAYAGSLFVVERLFRLLKPNIMRAPMLARAWARFVMLRGRALNYLQQLFAGRRAAAEGRASSRKDRH